MLNIPPVISTPSFPSAASLALAVSVADRVTTRITPQAVTAPVYDQRISENLPQPATTLPNAQISGNNPVASSNDSPQYLAQVLSQQTPDNALESAVNYSRFAPALQYNILVGYGFVKYKPSDAGIATARPGGNSQEVLAEQPLHAPSDYQVYAATQNRNAANLNADQPVQMIAG